MHTRGTTRAARLWITLLIPILHACPFAPPILEEPEPVDEAFHFDPVDIVPPLNPQDPQADLLIDRTLDTSTIRFLVRNVYDRPDDTIRYGIEVITPEQTIPFVAGETMQRTIVPEGDFAVYSPERVLELVPCLFPANDDRDAFSVVMTIEDELPDPQVLPNGSRTRRAVIQWRVRMIGSCAR